MKFQQLRVDNASTLVFLALRADALQILKNARRPPRPAKRDFLKASKRETVFNVFIAISCLKAIMGGGGDGVVVSFEGIDAAGKNTQSKMLFEYFKRSGTPVEFISFPDYMTAIGQEIRNFLDHKQEYVAEARHMLYAANRYEHKEQLEHWIAQGKIVVINRYIESNLAYGTANGLPLEWLSQLESRMPCADYVFYLKISPEVSASRKKNRDRYEADLAFLKRVSSVYEALAVPGRWFSIDANQSKDLVHYEIVRTISLLSSEKSNINQESSSSNRGR